MTCISTSSLADLPSLKGLLTDPALHREQLWPCLEIFMLSQPMDNWQLPGLRFKWRGSVNATARSPLGVEPCCDCLFFENLLTRCRADHFVRVSTYLDLIVSSLPSTELLHSNRTRTRIHRYTYTPSPVPEPQRQAVIHNQASGSCTSICTPSPQYPLHRTPAFEISPTHNHL